MNPFAAVLLAGGKSRRMGRDKALLPLPDGRLLWQRQLAVLEELGPVELFIAGPAREGFPTDVRPLADPTPGLGPMAGIAVALATMRSPRLVVLAVDLPTMTAEFLRGLLAADPGLGVIPRTTDGFFEPLAAVYPLGARSAAEQALRSDDLSLQAFVRGLLESGQAVAYPLAEHETALFINLNAPDDMPVSDRSDQ